MPRTIAIDLRCLSIPEKSERGTGQVVRPLLSGLAAIDSSNEYILFVHPDQRRPDAARNCRIVEVSGEYGDASRASWFQESVRTGRLLNKLRPDLYHSPDLYYPRGFLGPVLTTINDYYEFPLIGPFSQFEKVYGWRWNLRFRFRYAWTWRSLARWVDRIATISQNTADRIAAARPVLKNRLVPIPLGLGGEWKGRPPRPESVIEKHSLGKPLILHVGGFENRKNPNGILSAFRRLRQVEPGATLAMVGPPHGSRENLSGVRYLGYVSLDDLQRLYSAADCLLFPSFEEGFGLPIIEALSLGCPVVTSRGTATEETANGMAQLVDPYDHDDIHSGLMKTLALGRRAPLESIRRHTDVARDYLDLYNEIITTTPRA